MHNLVPLLDKAIEYLHEGKPELSVWWQEESKKHKIGKTGLEIIQMHVASFDKMINLGRYTDAAEIVSSLKIVTFQER